MRPAPLLFCSYALSLLCAVLAWRAGVGVAASALVFWIGGAAATLLLGLTPPFRARAMSLEPPVDIGPWEADRMMDAQSRSPGRAAERT